MLIELQSRFRQSLPPALLDDFDNLLRLTAAPRTSVVGSAPGGSSTASLSVLGTGERYEVLGLLGTGGMGEVRRVRDRDPGRTMAMKIIRSDRMQQPKVLACLLLPAASHGGGYCAGIQSWGRSLNSWLRSTSARTDRAEGRPLMLKNASA